MSIVKHLLSLPNPKRRKTSLTQHTMNPLRIDLKAQDNFGLTALQNALLKGYLDISQELINAGAALNQPTANEKSLLHWAALNISSEITLRFLIEKCHQANLNIHEVNEQGHTPFTLALVNDKQVATNVFLYNGIYLTHSIHKGTILHWLAIFTKDKTPLQKAITKHKQVDQNFNINEMNTERNTPLKLAILNENQAVVEVFMELGETLNLPAGNSTIPFDWVVLHSKHKNILQYVIAAESKKNPNFNIHDIYQPRLTLLGHAIICANRAAVEALIEAGAPLGDVNNSKQSALHIAAINVKDEAFLQFLIKKFQSLNIGIDELDQNNFTPLGYAIEHNNQIARNALLGAGATKNITIQYNRPGLH